MKGWTVGSKRGGVEEMDTCSHCVAAECLDNGLWSRSRCGVLYPLFRFHRNLVFYTVGLSLIQSL